MNVKVDSNRVYHPWHLWEDYQNSFHNNCTGSEKEQKISSVVRMFNSEEDTLRCMSYVADNWKYSMEHNLTNPQINQIAYIGQCACAYYDSVPSTVTMEAWSLLDNDTKERSNMLAQRVIDRWNNNNKLIQLCLNII